VSENQQDIRQRSFSVTRRGYDRAEVASFLASIASHLGSTDPASLSQKTFAKTRRGYDPDEVDAYLAILASQLGGSPIDTIFSSETPEVVEQPQPDADDFDITAERSILDEDAEHNEFVAALSEVMFEEPAAADSPAFTGSRIEAGELTGDEFADDNADIDATAREAIETPLEEPSFEETPEPVAPRAAAPSKVHIPTLPPLPEMAPVSVANVAALAPGGDGDLDEDGFQQAATEITALMQQAHGSALRLRSQAESEIRTVVEATEAELKERRRVEAAHLESQRTQAEKQIAAARSEAEAYVIEAKTRADRYLSDTKSEADAYAERQRSQSDTDTKTLVAEAESYAKATTENADDYDRRTRADSDAHSARVRSEAEAVAKRTLNLAEATGVELRAAAETERDEATRLMAEAETEAEEVRERARGDALRTLHEAHQEALRRSSVVLDQARELVANLSAIETESRDRLIEAQLSIAAAMERVTVSQLPDSDLVAKIAELVDAYDENNQLDDRPYGDLVDAEPDGDAPFS
jgi:DivIVA domain-containing protein